MMSAMIEFHRADIAALCRAHRVRRLDVFGSAARDDFDPERSDIDLLVEYEPGVVPSLKAYFALRDSLAKVLGHPVDLVMATAVTNPYINAAIQTERRLLYAA